MTIVCCDLDGVVWRGSDVFPFSARALGRLLQGGLQIVFTTNNSFRSQNDLAQRLQNLLKRADFDVLTSPMILGSYISETFSKSQTAFVLGEEALRNEIGSRIEIVESVDSRCPDVVVVGLDRRVTFERLAIAHRAISNGAAFLAANDDPAFPVENYSLPGAGSLVAFLERSTGQMATVVGKPNPPAIEHLKRLYGGGERYIVIGDRLDQDWGLARGLNARFFLVLTGSSQVSDCPSGHDSHFFIHQDLDDAVEAILSQDH
jgi:4-nitrophenyl phosphatase